MNIYIILLLAVMALLAGVCGVATHFFQNMGSNIGKNHMRELGLDDSQDEEEDDLRR